MTATQAPTPGPMSGSVKGRLAAKPWRAGDSLPAVGSAVLVSGANCDVDSDQHRAFMWRTVVGYGAQDRFVCFQTGSCWPTVERLENCWFAEIPTPRLAPPAPVEASGSERESVRDELAKLINPEAFVPMEDVIGMRKAYVLADKIIAHTGYDGINWKAEWEAVCSARIAEAALRPQPSGETREQMMGGGDVIALVDQSRWDCPNAPQLSYANGWNDAVSARPLALGGQQGEANDTAFKIASDLHAAYEQLIYGLPKYLEAENLTDEENMIRKAYITLDVTAHRLAALSTTPARAEAQDEGAAGELKPCPFCGGEAEIIHLDDGDNAGGSCVCCTKCQASGNVEFGRKEKFVDNWNRRAHPSPTPAADADRVREALKLSVDALFDLKAAFVKPGTYDGAKGKAIKQAHVAHRSALAALKSTAAKEGGE